MREKRDAIVQFRVSKKEKEEIQEQAQKQGFEGVSHFFLWLFRKYGKKGK